MKTFGELLRAEREAQGISLNALARELGISAPYLSDVERDRRSPLQQTRLLAATRFLRIEPVPLLEAAARARGFLELEATGPTDTARRVGAELVRHWSALDDRQLRQIEGQLPSPVFARTVTASTGSSRPGLATRDDLRRWADRSDAAVKFPSLLRRLILETAQVVEIDFPGDEAVRSGGWDGIVWTSEPTLFVPGGLSSWEVSVNGGPGRKADHDYKNRTEGPDGCPAAEVTYVQAILRPWTKRREWRNARRAEDRWRSVDALGLDDIVAWLEQAPATHAWLSEEIGLRPFGFRTAERWWQDWRGATRPELPAEVVLAGRSEEVTNLLTRLQERPRTTAISASSAEEALAFIVAVLRSSSGSGSSVHTAVVVDDASAWRALHGQGRQLVLIPNHRELAHELPSGPHHVVVPLANLPAADISLGRLNADIVAEAIQRTGIQDDVAQELGRVARLSVVAMRRRIAKNPALAVPAWIEGGAAPATRGALLAGRWNDNHPGDGAIVTALARGTAYADLRDQFLQLSGPDPLLQFVEGAWCVVDPHSAWLMLRDQVTDTDLDQFESAVRTVLGERDPRLDLPPEDRWLARVRGKVRSYSSNLRRGLAASLALLGTHGLGAQVSPVNRGSARIDTILASIFTEANEDATGDLWASLCDQLPLLAEAAPAEFLKAVRRGLQGAEPVLTRVFHDRDSAGMFGPSSPHADLLWALEILAWSDEYFGAAVDALAGLADVDPGGKLGNRPSGSLAGIFCPWHPETCASVARRVEVFDALRARHPDAAWQLGLRILPEFRGVHSPTARPQFRQWVPQRPTVTIAEHLEFIEEATDRLVSDAGTSAARWSDLIDRATNLPAHLRARVWSALSATTTRGHLDQPAELWRAVRKVRAQHRQYADAEWALPASEVERLGEIEFALRPSEPTRGYAWLFEEWFPDLPDGSEAKSSIAYSEALARRRVDAVSTILEEGGVRAIRKLAARSEVPWQVGLAFATEREPVDELIQLVGSDGVADAELAFAAVAKWYERKGWSWIDDLLRSSILKPEQQAQILLATRDYPRAWEAAAALGGIAEHEFWAHFGTNGLGRDFAHVEHAAGALLRVGRPDSSLWLLQAYADRSRMSPARRCELVFEALELYLRLAQRSSDSNPSLDGYDVQRAIAFLEEHAPREDADRLAALEWAYLPALGYEPQVPTLHSLLGRDPAFFVEVVSAIYRPRTVTRSDETTPEERSRAENAYRLLDSWRSLPAASGDGSIAGEALSEWVVSAIELLEKADRLEVGSVCIGQTLANAPADSNGRWPCESVREVIEKLQSDDVEEGIRVGRSNQRGVTRRAIGDGGTLERELAATYARDAAACRDRWPRTAAMLRDLSSSYEGQAIREDASAERRAAGLDP